MAWEDWEQDHVGSAIGDHSVSGNLVQRILRITNPGALSGFWVPANETEFVGKFLVFLLVLAVGGATAVRFVKKERHRAAKFGKRD